MNTLNTSDKNHRPDPRGQIAKEEDPRERAARRAAEIREHSGGLDDGTDEFAAPTPPDGWSYEWKRKTILGQEDPAYAVHLARQGWEPVPLRRHPEMMPAGHPTNTIERKGLILMERPKELVEEARDIEKRRARDQVRTKEEQLGATPNGTLPRDADPRTKPVVKKGYEPIPIPKD